MFIPLSEWTVSRRERSRVWHSPEGVRQEPRAFLLFVIIPPSLCRAAFGGDKKQPDRVDSELLLPNSETPKEIVTVQGTNFFSVPLGRVYKLSGIYRVYSQPLAASLSLTRDFHFTCATSSV